MHDVSRDAITRHEAPPGEQHQESAFDRFVERYKAFVTPLTAIVLLVAAGVAGAKSAGRFNLAITAMAICGYPILRGALYSTVTQRKLNAEVLVVIALMASVWVGEYIAGAMVALMMNLGERLEDLTITKTGDAIRSLMRLAPDEARVLRQGREQRVGVAAVRVDERVIVYPGERIPVDGVVAEGSSEVDQAAITGESMPVAKERGDKVYGGTLNQLGALQIQVTRVGEDTTLARIIALVHAAQADKPPIERIADRFAAWFTPTMLTLAVLVWGITGELIRAVTVLVVACPCAMVIATPTAVVAGIGNAARKGILIKGGRVLERLGQLTAVVFDKTGTLTHGRPQVQRVVSFGDPSAESVLQLAASAELHSGHPLAAAILDHARERQLQTDLPGVTQVVAGKGVLSRQEERQVVVGNRALFLEQGLPVNETAEAFLKSSGAQGTTAVLVGVDQRVVGGIAVADTLRPEVQTTVRQLRQLGLERLVMLSGDAEPVAKNIARLAGIDAVFANLLPEEKLDHIRALRQSGATVAMVGDGLNDAPSLAEADIGIAMGVIGTDTAIDAADIALTTDKLDRVVEAIALSRQTLVNIKQSFALSLLINVAALILASTGGIGPVAGAVLHNIGSLVVVGNSARLIVSSSAPKR